MSDWWELPMWGFDLETTSVQVDEARVVTASLVLVGGGAISTQTRWLVDPGIEIPDGAIAVHGITTEKARAEGVPAAEGIRSILDALQIAFTIAPVAVMNASYDFSILDREARRYGFEPLDPKPVVDPYVMDKQLDRFRRGSRTLSALAKTYGVDLENAHSSDADAAAAAELVRCMGVIARLPDPDTLHHLQIEWRAKQVTDLEAYFRRKGGNELNLPTEWPVVPGEPL